MKLMTKKEVQELLKIHRGEHYVYCLHRKSGEIFYVGIGNNYRCLWHVQPSSRKKDGNLLKQRILAKENYDILFQIVLFSTEESCLLLERKLIHFFGRRDSFGLLSNLTDGGERGPTGMIVSEETKELKRKLSLDKVELHREAAKKQWNDLTEEERKQKIEYLQKFANGPEAREKIGKKSKEMWKDPAFKEKRRLDSIERWKDPAYRERVLSACRAAKERKTAQ